MNSPETLRGHPWQGTCSSGCWTRPALPWASGCSHLDRAAAAPARCHQPPSGCCGKPGQPNCTARRRSEELHYIADLERVMTTRSLRLMRLKEIPAMAQTCDACPACASERKLRLRRAQRREWSPGSTRFQAISGQSHAAVVRDASTRWKDGDCHHEGYHPGGQALRSIAITPRACWLSSGFPSAAGGQAFPSWSAITTCFIYFIEVSNSYSRHRCRRATSW